LDFKVADLEQQSKTWGNDLVQITDAHFRADDKLLSSLEKLGWELDAGDPEEERVVEQLREICMR
jgi:hypothetical protein